MQMNMPTEVLLPGMQYQREGRYAAQMTRVAREFIERGRNSAEQILVERSWRHSNQGVEHMRQGEYQMEIRDRQHLTSPCSYPRFLCPCLTTRAMPVPAGVIEVTMGSASIAKFKMPSQCYRPTRHNGTPDLGATARQRPGGEISCAKGV